MSIEVDDEIYYDINYSKYGDDEIFINIGFKPRITDEDKEFFYRLGICKMGFYGGYNFNFNYILNGIGYSIDPTIWNYNHAEFGLNSVLLRSLNIRFMKMNKREGNFMCKDPWKDLL